MQNVQQQIEALKSEANTLNEMAHTARIGGHTGLFNKFIAQAVTVIKQKRQLESQVA